MSDRRRPPRPTVALRGVLAALACLALVVSGTPSRADPPPWAPAHGYRAKHGHGHGHGPKHVPYDDEHWSRTYEEQTRKFGILEGTCHREEVGAVLGGAVGAVAGSRFGKGDGRIAATIAGTAVGILAGASIGRAMDEADQQCIGQTLERAPDGRTVTWQDPGGGSYEVTPLRTVQSGERYCREYRTEARVDGELRRVFGTACRDEAGAWRIVNRAM